MAKAVKTVDGMDVKVLKDACPPDCHAAIDQLQKVGVSFLTILGLIAQFGPKIADLVNQIVDAYNQIPKAAKQCDDSCPELIKCQREHLLQALCDNICMEHNHTDHDEEDDEETE